MRHPSFWFAPLLLAVSLPGWTEVTVYRWKDASGQSHFSQTPPTSGGYDVMRGNHGTVAAPAAGASAPASTSTAATDQRARDQRFIEEAEAARKAKAEAKEKEKTAKAEKEKRCSTAREHAKFMEESFAYVGGDDFLRRRDAALKDVATNCS
jgi:hypothetical protein